MGRFQDRSSRLSRRELLGAPGGAGVGLIAAACISTPAATPTATPASAAAKPSTPAAAKPSVSGSIAYFDTDDDPASSAGHEKYHADFTAMYPDAQVEATHLPSADYQTKLTTALATGAHLDMLFWDTTNTFTVCRKSRSTSRWASASTRRGCISSAYEPATRSSGGRTRAQSASSNRS